MERLAELQGAMGTVQKSWGKPWKHMEKQWENYGNNWNMGTCGNICVLLFFDDERCWKIWKTMENIKYGKRYGNHIKCWNNTGKDMGNGCELGE